MAGPPAEGAVELGDLREIDVVDGPPEVGGPCDVVPGGAPGVGRCGDRRGGGLELWVTLSHTVRESQ